MTPRGHCQNRADFMDLGICSLSRKVCVLGPVSYKSGGHGDTYNLFWGKEQPQTVGKDIRWGLKCVLDWKVWCWTIGLAAGVAELWHTWESNVYSLPGLEILTFHFLPFQPWNLTSSFVSNMWVFCVNVWVCMCTCSCVRGYMCEFKCTYLCIPVEWKRQPQVV